MKLYFGYILFLFSFFRIEASQNVIDIHWVMSLRSIQPTGFFSELLGFSASLVHQFPNIKLTKSFFTLSLDESPLANNLMDILFSDEKAAIETMVNDTIPESPLVEVPRSQYIQEKNVTSDEWCQDSSSWLTNVTVSGKELSKSRALLSQSNPTMCCVACARHFGCMTWSYVNGNCRLHRQQYPMSQVTASKAVPQIDDISPVIVDSPPAVSYVGSFSLAKRYPKPRVIVLHGTNCFYQNTSVAFHRDVDTIIIGRFMLERSMQLQKFTADERAIIACLHLMDELWVPTEWHRDIFHRLYWEQSAKSPPPITVIGEAVDPNLFSPLTVPGISEIQELDTTIQGHVSNIAQSQVPTESFFRKLKGKECVWTKDNQRIKCNANNESFDFLSIFKWESRKGWDVLLTAFISTFTAEDDVRLQIYTNDVIHDLDMISLWTRIQEFINTTFPTRSFDSLPRIEIVDSSITYRSSTIQNTQNKSRGNLHLQQIHQAFTRIDMRNLYASVDAFVLPTRGEGWGLPIAEAMSMALPVIVTDAPGPRAFTQPADVSSRIAYILDVKNDTFDELGFVQPDIHHLTHLLRQIINDSSSAAGYEAQKRGKRARDYMKTHWRSEQLVGLMDERIRFHTKLRGWNY